MTLAVAIRLPLDRLAGMRLPWGARDVILLRLMSREVVV